ncbi:FAD-dependent oxidoreductase [Vibrio fluvialis]|nr:FAD-dependent oxidoreductase [Vibrio fluvialis]
MENQNVKDVDVCIIGAGPAGMAAAIRCAQVGAKVAVVDEQPRPGGQIYRAVTRDGHPNGHIFGPDYLYGANLVAQFQRAAIEHINEATLWRIDENKRVYWSRGGKAEQLQAKRIILATGAIERAFPFPGWTLPGVMTAGACQIMMKTSGVVPQQAVMVGTGPLLYLLAAQMVDAGSAPLALVDTQQPNQYFKSAKYASSLWTGRKYILKGLKLLAKLRKAGIKHYTGATDVAAFGDGKFERLSFSCGSNLHLLEAQNCLAHIGVIPNVQLSRAMGLAHEWDNVQLCWRPSLDDYYSSSLEGVAIAGDGSGIGGALVAELQGRLAGANALHEIGKIPPFVFSAEAKTLKKQIRQELAIRPFLDTLYSPPRQAMQPADDTIICRCEEVTAGQIRQHARAGVNGINQIKTFTRCGMGPCQGRYCGPVVAQVISMQTAQPMEKVGYYRIRHPIKPLKLGELASLTSHKQSFMHKYQHKEFKHVQHSETIHQSTHEQSSDS